MNRILFFIVMCFAWQLDAMYLGSEKTAQQIIAEQQRKAYAQECFYWCVLNCSLQAMKDMIIHESIDVNVPDVVGDTPLMYATLINRIDKVEVLLAMGAQLDKKNTHGQTAEDWAKAFGYTKLLEYFKAYRAANGLMQLSKICEEEKR